MILNIVILVALVRLLIATDKPFLCSGIYTGAAVIFKIILGTKLLPLLIAAVIVLALSSFYFWLLNRLDYGTLLWWVFAIFGMAVGVI